MSSQAIGTVGSQAIGAAGCVGTVGSQAIGAAGCVGTTGCVGPMGYRTPESVGPPTAFFRCRSGAYVVSGENIPFDEWSLPGVTRYDFTTGIITANVSGRCSVALTKSCMKLLHNREQVPLRVEGQYEVAVVDIAKGDEFRVVSTAGHREDMRFSMFWV